MKQLWFKRIDILLQLLVVIIPPVVWGTQGWGMTAGFLTVVQLISAVVNQFVLKRHFIGTPRKLYGIFAIIFALLSLLLYWLNIEDLSWLFLIVLMVAMPLMCFLYFVACIEELYKISRALPAKSFSQNERL
jgi:hypothetical protein